jgi:hypothetical protein
VHSRLSFLDSDPFSSYSPANLNSSLILLFLLDILKSTTTLRLALQLYQTVTLFFKTKYWETGNCTQEIVAYIMPGLRRLRVLCTRLGCSVHECIMNPDIDGANDRRSPQSPQPPTASLQPPAKRRCLLIIWIV